MAAISHVLNRGVDKRDIFIDDQDRFRFVHDLFEFNDEDWVDNHIRLFRTNNDIGNRKLIKSSKPRKLLVDILAFSLMQNHYHLLLSPRVESGIAKFMQKLNMGYSKYFNTRYERKGTLFQGRYKSTPITTEKHFIHIPYYIHANPLDLMAPGWRDREIKSYKDANDFLESYRWSSHLDYLGKNNFPSVTNRKFLTKFFAGPKEYQKSFSKWLRDMDNKSIDYVTLEK